MKNDKKLEKTKKIKLERGFILYFALIKITYLKNIT